VTSQLAYIGVLMLVFGLGSFYATEHFAAFNIANVIGGGAALVAAMVLNLRRLRFGGGPHARRVVTRGVLTIVAATALGVGLERAAHFSNIQYDWTFERHFELSDATLKACADLGSGLRATLYHDPADPRTRRTRLLLRTLASECEMETRSEDLDHDSIDVDRFEIGSSNTVVIEYGLRFETVSRPTEGAIYEALYRLRSATGGTIALLRGEGEGNPDSGNDLGFSGLATALSNEGYRLRTIVTPVMTEVPEDTTLVLSLGPRRHLRDEPLEALGRYLERGGRLVALLEPGVETGIEQLLGRYGLRSPNSLVIDPSSGDMDEKVVGLNPVAYNYTTHAVTQGLNSNRMTFFSGARSFVLRKAQPRDRLTSVVMASPKSWISEDLALLHRHSGKPEPGSARTDYYPLVVTGKFQRESGETRIVAFGDSDFATNRYLRAVYNLDLILNAVHWVAERESEITIRPKAGAPLHFPLPIADSLRTLYSVGLLVPELLLVAGGLVWLRRRAA
jgi:hypothetical protein